MTLRRGDADAPVEPRSAVALQRAIDRAAGLDLRGNPRAAAAWPIPASAAIVGRANGHAVLVLSGPSEAPALVSEGDGEDRSVSVAMNPEEALVRVGALVRGQDGIALAPGFSVVRDVSSLPADLLGYADFAREFRARVVRERRRNLRKYGRESRPLTGGGEVEYVGFGAVQRRSRFTIDQIHAVVDRAMIDAQQAWGWRGSLWLSFYRGWKTVGTAMGPGGSDRRVRRIALSDSLLAESSAADVRRVVLHELCHHYREEHWPRDPSVAVAAEDSHDDTFCQAFALVEPSAGDPRRCRYFAADALPLGDVPPEEALEGRSNPRADGSGRAGAPVVRRVRRQPPEEILRALAAWDRISAEVRRSIHPMDDEGVYESVDALSAFDRTIQDAHYRRRLEDEGGLYVLAAGGTRMVLKIDDGRVLKLPLDGGRDANVSEARLWSSASARLARHLAPVLAADPGGAWLVMAFAEWDARPSREALVQVRAARIADIENPHNWRELDGLPVMVDYAGNGLDP